MSKKSKKKLYLKKVLLNISVITLILGMVLISSAMAQRDRTEQEEILIEIENIELGDNLLMFHNNTLSQFHLFSPEEKTVISTIISDGNEYRVARVKRTTLTAYSSTVCQTDSTPFITASGAWVRDGIIAANFLPFGSKVRIPSIFGDKVFIVKDRMNRRFNSRVDIWMTFRQDALNFGIKQADIEILERI